MSGRRFPSLREIGADAAASFARFPLVLVASGACGATIAWTLATGRSGLDVQRVVESCGLGIALAFALATLAERRHAGRLPAIVPTLLLVGGYFVANASLTQTAAMFRTLQLGLAAHLLVAFAPYLGRGFAGGFWEYNQRLFTRFTTAVFFSGVLFVGLAIALVTVHWLLDVEVSVTAYAYLWLAVAFGFNTWFFLAGVPVPLPAGDGPAEVPRALRIFTQRLLIPLVTIYLLILYAYMAKIAVTATWPEGTVAYLVSAFSALGILALLLVDPLADSHEHRWMRAYARGFYLALFPLVVLLVLATWRRIDEYGFTERRYFVLAFGLWLGALATYFTFAPRRDIRLVPISLSLVAVLTVAGPWGAYEVSRRDQIGRLTRLLEERGILVGGRIQPASAPVDADTRCRIASILDYLTSIHGDRDVQPWLVASANADVTAGRNPVEGHETTVRVMRGMGMEYVPSYECPAARKAAAESFSWTADQRSPLAVAGYDVLVEVRFATAASSWTTSWNGRSVAVALKDDHVVTVSVGDRSASAPLDDVVAALRGQGKRTSADMTLAVESPSLRARVVFTFLSGRWAADGPRVAIFGADVLISLP